MDLIPKVENQEGHNNKVRAVVIGFGSIGRRHANILSELGCDVTVVSSHPAVWLKKHEKIEEAIVYEQPDYIVIANNTDKHYDTLNKLWLNQYVGKILIEKPVFKQWTNIAGDRSNNIYIGYNLRFHPVIEKIRKLIDGEELICASLYTGQYLPDWRPGQDYRRSYSSSRELGGGVLRDLSHEIDLINLIFGKWDKLVSSLGHYSKLEIDCEDCASVMFKTERCALVDLHVNYIDKICQRQIIINTEKHTIKADLINGTVNVDGAEQKYEFDNNHTYREMHKAIIHDKQNQVCSLREGLDVLRVIEAIEKSAARGIWVYNETV